MVNKVNEVKHGPDKEVAQYERWSISLGVDGRF